MPSVFTLEGPNLGYAQAVPVPPAAGVLRDASQPSWYGVVGLLAIAAAGWYGYQRYKRGRGLFGPDMLSTIAKESRSVDEFARRAEAWNAGNAKKLSDEALARKFRRSGKRATAALIRKARREREAGRDRLFHRLSKGLKGAGLGSPAAEHEKRAEAAVHAVRFNVREARKKLDRGACRGAAPALLSAASAWGSYHSEHEGAGGAGGDSRSPLLRETDQAYADARRRFMRDCVK